MAQGSVRRRPRGEYGCPAAAQGQLCEPGDPGVETALVWEAKAGRRCTWRPLSEEDAMNAVKGKWVVFAGDNQVRHVFAALILKLKVFRQDRDGECGFSQRPAGRTDAKEQRYAPRSWSGR